MVESAGLQGWKGVAGMRASAFTLALLLIAMGAQPAFAYRFIGSETQLTTDVADQFDPSISGAITVYSDRRNADADIYLYDIEQGLEVQVTSGGGDQLLNDVSGDRVVFTDYGTGNAEILVYEVSSGSTTQVTNHPANQRRPAISGDRVVYEDDRNGNYDIYLFDLASGIETQLTFDPGHQRKPAISGDVVVWEDFRNGNADVYMLDLVTSAMTQVTSDVAQDVDPDVDGDLIVFGSNRANIGDIYYYRISTGELVAATADAEYERNPSVSGDFIAFESYAAGDSDIWIYSVSLMATEQATVDPAEQYLHDISNGRIVYTDNRNDNLDIYLFEFTFEDPPAGGTGCDDPDAIAVFGPRVYTRGHGCPVFVLDGFAGPDLAGDAYLCITNGTPDGENRVTSAQVALNGEMVARPNDFSGQVESIEKGIELRDVNVVGVELRGAPGSQFSMWVAMVPPEDDPIIITCSTTDPSAGSWSTGLVFFLLLLFPVVFNRALVRVRRRR